MLFLPFRGKLFKKHIWQVEFSYDLSVDREPLYEGAPTRRKNKSILYLEKCVLTGSTRRTIKYHWTGFKRRLLPFEYAAEI